MEDTKLKKWIVSLLIFILLSSLLIACNSNNNENDENDELAMLEVDFDVPEHAGVGDTFEIKATVTYGDEMVTDAHEVVFEVWEKNDRDNGEMIDAKNHEDGTYTTELKFDQDGIYEMYAHTTARDLHVMPKKEVVIGEGGEYEEAEDHGYHTEGFHMEFMEPMDVTKDEEATLEVQISLHDEPLENAKVRYEIWNDDESEQDWVDTEEQENGTYVGTYEFPTQEKYNIQVHVEDDADLHEHQTYEINVK